MTKWETIQEERVHHLSSKIRSGLAAVALLAAMAGVWTRPARAQAAAPAPNAPAQKAVKDQGEFDIYNDVTKDMLAKNFAKAITDLDTWKQKYPASDFKDDRSVLYIQAYAGGGQWAKAVDETGLLMAKDLKAVLNDPKTGPSQQVRVLFTATTAIQQVPNPTADELATAAKAAQQLMDYNTKPEGASDADWATARAQLQAAAKGALLYITLKPGMDAMQKKDWPAAEAAFQAAQKQYPDSSQVAYQLGATELAQQASNPAKISQGLYEIARSVSIDPAKSDFADPSARTRAEAYLKSVYPKYHGGEDGLDQLKQQALASPAPPPDFHILSATEIYVAKQKEFAEKYPELALWMNIKAALTDTNGEQYFKDSMKDAPIPKLKGTLVEAKPACRSKELLVAVPLPDAKPPFKAEIALKLDAPLTGKPDEGLELVWTEGVPSAFTKEPFLLTIDVEKAKIEGVKTTPCAPPPVHHPVTKKK
jgi:outer membrane protein assembly factor BamD (BamD/ComL family)